MLSLAVDFMIKKTALQAWVGKNSLLSAMGLGIKRSLEGKGIVP